MIKKRALITDFGLSFKKHAGSSSSGGNKLSGAGRFIAPERYKPGYKATTQYDVFHLRRHLYIYFQGNFRFMKNPMIMMLLIISEIIIVLLEMIMKN
jgi:hypothetical protein